MKRYKIQDYIDESIRSEVHWQLTGMMDYLLGREGIIDDNDASFSNKHERFPISIDTWYIHESLVTIWDDESIDSIPNHQRLLVKKLLEDIDYEGT